MKVKAKTIEAFFENSTTHSESLRHLDRFIQTHLPELDRKLYTSDTTCVLGYGEIPYTTASYTDKIPILSIAPQKNNMSIYVMAWKDGQNLVEIYAGQLGKVSCGKSCIRFKKFSDLNLEELQKLLIDISDVHYKIAKKAL